MKSILLLTFFISLAFSQKTIPLDTMHWKINKGASYLLENFEGKKHSTPKAHKSP